MARRKDRLSLANLTQWERQYRHALEQSRPERGAFSRRRELVSTRSSASVTTLLFAGALITQPGGASIAAAPLPNGTLPIPRVANFATSGSATVSTTGTAMTINQQSQRAILNWNSFNIAADSSVRFNQPGPTAVALNRIADTANPSLIQGQLSANGQVYLINRNGIMFDKGSQVNVNTLIASTLDINDNLFNNGILSAAAFGPVFQQNAGDPDSAQVVVEVGARIQTDSGGRVLLIGPSVTNRGEIRTPDGQTILAAGNKVYLRTSEDLNLRGFLVEVDTGLVAADPAKAAVNEGQITAERGNISMVGLAVRQSGVLTTTTSTSANGSIVLNARDTVELRDARDFSTVVEKRAGIVTLTSGSQTEVKVDTSDKAGIDANVSFNPSRVDISGKRIVHEGSIVAPAGTVTLTALDNPSLASQTTPSTSRVYLADGSSIDVAGNRDTVLPASSNQLSVELRGDELKDFPLQRDGILRGQKVTIDVTKGTTLADVAKQIAAVPRGIGEVTATGGTVGVISEGDIVMQRGSRIDVSGGQIAYERGTVGTSRVVSQGRVFDISTAPADRVYDAVLTGGVYTQQSKKWGVTETFDIGRSLQPVTPGFVKGASAGNVNFQAHALAIDGTLIGKASAGEFQRQSDKVPAAGSLTIADYPLAGIETPRSRGHDVVLQTGPSGFSAIVTDDDPLPNQPLVLSTDFLSRGGFGRLTLDRNGSIDVPKGVDLNLPAGGAVSIAGRAVNVGSNFSVPGGSITLQTRNTTVLDPPGSLGGPLVIGPGSTLSTQGLWVNDLPAITGATGATGPLMINGGNISINAASDLRLGAIAGDQVLPAVLDVGGGGWVNVANTFKAGNGGNLSIGGASVQLAAVLRGMAAGTGGTLTIRGSDVAIRNGVANPTPAGTTLSVGEISTTGAMSLPSWMFDTLGFTKYEVRASGNLAVSANTDLNLAAPYLALTQNARSQATGSDIQSVTQRETFADVRRPASLTLAHFGVEGRSTLNVESGSYIHADPGATIALSTNASMIIDGRIDAPAGSISLAVAAVRGQGYSPQQAIWLGSQSQLSTAGTVKLAADPLGRRIGSVLDGGNVSIVADRGYVVSESGSRIDVSGAQSLLDIPELGGARARALVSSNAGTIRITAAEGMLLDGDLTGRAGGTGAAGGSLALTMTLRNRIEGDITGGTDFPFGNRAVTLMGSSSASVPPGLKPGAVIQRRDAGDLNGQALISVNKITGGGFSQFSAKSDQDIRFADSVTLRLERSVVLDAPHVDIANQNVALHASYVALGSSDPLFQTPPIPATGTGTLVVKANLVELIGHGAVGGASNVTLASDGDVRVRGVQDSATNRITGAFAASGSLELKAAQVYPTTFSEFSVSSLGDLLISPNASGNEANVPLSAGGNLRFTAPNITVSGTLRAPFGELDLRGQDNLTLSPTSVVSVSGRGMLVPFGNTQNGLEWVYSPSSNANLLVAQPPEKSVRLGATNVLVSPGATVDLSGGGNLYAYEFVPGPGGSKDALANIVDNKANPLFAILPGLKSSFAPFDQQYYTDATLKPGDSVFLAGGGGLAAGIYPLLPARYGLLPGAYLIQAATGVTSIVPGQNLVLGDGAPVVAGYRTAAGVNTTDLRWGAYSVRPGAAGRLLAEYRDTLADAFFASRASVTGNVIPPLPADAGRLAINATQQLALAGAVLRTEHDPAARGAEVDISATRLAIVSSDAPDSSGLSDFVRISPVELAGLNAESLLLGGTRTPTDQGIDIAVTAQDVVVANSATTSLRAPEVIIAANNTVSVRSGASIDGVGTRTASNISIGFKHDPAKPLTVAAQIVRRDINGDSVVDAGDNIDGRGALLRVSGGEQVEVIRNNVVDRTRGTIEVQTDARVSGRRSLILDATSDSTVRARARIGAGALTRDTNADGVIDEKDDRIGGAVSLSAGLISAGDVVGAGGGSGVERGLLLSNSILDQLRGVSTLALHSYSSIDFYGSAQLGTLDSTSGKPFLASLELSGAGIGGYGGDSAVSTVNAGIVRFNNSTGGVTAGIPDGSGKLQIAADRVILGVGEKTISGFSQVDIAGRTEIRFEGDGTTKVAAALALDAPRLTADVASRQTLSAVHEGGPTGATYFPLLISSPKATPVVVAPADSAAAQIEMNGAHIQHVGTINLPGGSITLNARGDAGDVRLGSEATITTRGITRSLAGVTAGIPGGNVTLTSDRGNVTVDTGALIDVGADASDAGRITVNAPGGVASVLGAIYGRAPTGFQGGAFLLDARYVGNDVATTVNDISSLNVKLGDGGFTNERSLRLRKGDIAIEAGDVVNALNVKLIADDGRIDIRGTIDASGPNGGQVLLAARSDVTLDTTGMLKASASTEGGSGGDITASTVTGQVNFKTGSTVNVTKYSYQPGEINVSSIATTVAGGGTFSAFTADLNTAPTDYVQGLDVIFRAPDNSRGPGTLALSGLKPVPIKRSDGTNLAADDFRAGDIVKLTFDGTYFRMPAGENGHVLLRAPRNLAGNDVAITALGEITGAREIVGEAVKVYLANTISNAPDSSTNFSTAVTGNANVEAGNFVNATNFNRSGVRRRLSSSASDAFHVRPGVEVQSTGDLTVSGTAWNLLTWRYNGEPGALTLRAPGNISVNASISDGFSTATSGGLLRDTLSWSYRLTSGADLSGANAAAILPLTGAGALAPDTGNLMVSAGTLVRTGTGTIDIASGRDFSLGKTAAGPNLPTAAVYTAGKPSEIFPTSGTAGFPTTNLTTASYPTAGGDLTIRAQQDIFGAISPQLISAWLLRRGQTNATTGGIVANRNTGWGIDFARFQQNTGALGGGDVTVSAGGDVENLSVMLPTAGRLLGAAASQPDANNLVVTGGGNLSVSAGGSIRSGVYYVGRGSGALRAGDQIESGRTVQDTNANAPADLSTLPVNTILALGDGRFDVRAGRGVTIETVLNPTAVKQESSVTPNNRTFFYTYAPAAAARLESLSGDVNLSNSQDALTFSVPGATFESATGEPNALLVYPGRLDGFAVNGNIGVGRSFTLYPSPQGNLQLIAGGNVRFDLNPDSSSRTVNLSDADPNLLLNPLRLPQAGSSVSYAETDSRLNPVQLARLTHALIPVHQQETDSNPVRVVAANGSITGGSLYFSKAAQFYAATDVRDLQIEVQNLRGDDTTSVVAGRDVAFATPRDVLTGKQQENAGRIFLSGPGRLEVEAGRNIDLGNSQGIVTRANISNPSLPPTGADVALAAGISATPAYGKFVTKYFNATEKHEVGEYMRGQSNDAALSDELAIAAFDALARPRQLAAPFMPLIRNRFYNELTQSGREAVLPGGSYQRGFSAIETLLPGTAYRGDLSLLFSQVKTESGGRIDILVPGGRVNAGQTTPPAQSGSNKDANDLGLLVFDDGAIHAFSKGDFAVNESRVFTLKGGDILIWSSEGNIDAGRGAKTAVSAPAPILVTDSSGNTSFKFQSVSGSGIRSILTRSDIVPGSVDLIAPSGVVNAGDAGIGSAGNINIAALRVVGADNIQVGGKASGVPLSDTGAAGRGLAGLGNVAADATRSVDQATRSLGSGGANDELRPGIISVEVLSIGNQP